MTHRDRALHYRMAEELLRLARDTYSPRSRTDYLAMAQVHATLATAPDLTFDEAEEAGLDGTLRSS